MFLFTWFFLSWTEDSCARVPLLGPYLTGVAVTSVAGLLLSFPNILTEDNHDNEDNCEEEEEREDTQDGVLIGVVAKKRNGTKYENQNWLEFSNNESNEEIEAECGRIKPLSTISTFILFLHLCLMMMGSCCILPILPMEVLGGNSGQEFRLPNCQAPAKFWAPFLTLCLQWGLGAIFTVWWVVEIKWGESRSDGESSDCDSSSLN